MDYSIYKGRCSFLISVGFALSELNRYDNFEDLMTEEEFNEIIKGKQNRKNKRYRCDRKILEMQRIQMAIKSENIRTYIVFGTCTFNDKKIQLKEDTKMRLLNGWLKRHFLYAIVNKDFGDKTNREHYHFIALTKPKEEFISVGRKSNKGRTMYNLKEQDYKLGFEPDLEIINFDDKKKVRNYLLKLNNHTNKTTSNGRLRVIKDPFLKFFSKQKKSDLRYT